MNSGEFVKVETSQEQRASGDLHLVNAIFEAAGQGHKFQEGECFAGSFTRELHGPLTWARAVSKSDEAKAVIQRLKDEIRPLLKYTSVTLVALSDLLLENLEEAWNDEQTLFYANTSKCGLCRK